MFVKRSSVYLITASKKQSSTEGYGNQNTEEKALELKGCLVYG